MTPPFWYRLFFTRDDDLDLLQVLFLVWCVFTAVTVGLVGAGVWRLPTAAFALLGSTFVTLAIAGTPTWIAKLIATSKAPGQVAEGVAQAGGVYGPRTLAFDDLDAGPGPDMDRWDLRTDAPRGRWGADD